MHLRLSSPQCEDDDHQHYVDTMQLIKPLGAGVAGYCQHTTSPSAWKRTKRLFLWSILVVQFGFILCFWLMQLGLSGHISGNPTGALKNVMISGDGEEKRIHFVKPQQKQEQRQNTLRRENSFQWPSRDRKFQQDFILQQSNFNLTEAEKQMFGADSSIWCFKEGTANISTLRQSMEDDNSQWPDSCKCLPEWHGQDCGQPEVIWRALMTAKLTFKLQNPTQDEAHRLVYMIEGPLLSMDLLELQIQAVIKVVDYFIIYCTRNPTSAKDLKTLKFRLRKMIPENNYLLYICKLTAQNANCSSAEAYRIFRQQQLFNNAIKPTDLYIYTDDRVILGHRALNFLKYYASIIPVVEFRLKFNVYGFYWQHPQLTKLKGIICTFQHVENINGNPKLLSKSLVSLSSSTSQDSRFVIGDLNHFGGWFCKYCQQPDEIINELENKAADSLTSTEGAAMNSILAESAKTFQNEIQFPKDKKHSLHIDSLYIQQLISLGLYLNDGKTQLFKVRRFSDKYFAPQYASKESWKYGHLLVNIYESQDDDNEEDLL